MIHTSQPDDTPGSRAAQRLARLIAADWPDVELSETDHVHVLANVKCFGKSAVDIDLVVFVNLSAPRPIGADGETIRTALLAIEVKDHPPERVEFEGSTVRVWYGSTCRSVTEQNEKQVHALRTLIGERVGKRPYVHGLIWLTNVGDVPYEAVNVIPATATWDNVLKRIAILGGLRFGLPTSSNGFANAIVDTLGKRLVPSSLDRKRIERLSQGHLDGQKYAEKFGTQMLIFKGQGGTGKTITLLRIAHDLALDRGRRILFLTYNLALVSDLRRLIDLMMRDEPRMALVEVSSAMRYFRAACAAMGVRPGEDFVDSYSDYLARAVAALGDEKARERIERSGWTGFDSVFIDEGQDWDPRERELLLALFGPGRLVVADGLTQLVRKDEPLDWRSPIAAGQSQIVHLRKGLRLKQNLGRFVSRFAKGLEHDWEVDVVPDLLGGRVIVLQGEPESAVAWSGALIEELRRRDVFPIDLLACVPPRLVRNGRCTLVPAIGSLGIGIWDGCSKDDRKVYPVDHNQLRVVQYDSCRGLEGWAVFALALNDFWDYRMRRFDDRKSDRGLFDTRAMRAKRSCANWLMIPLTRGIDTLVINVTARDHPVAALLRRIAAEMPDVVEWVVLPPPPRSRKPGRPAGPEPPLPPGGPYPH